MKLPSRGLTAGREREREARNSSVGDQTGPSPGSVVSPLRLQLIEVSFVWSPVLSLQLIQYSGEKRELRHDGEMERKGERNLKKNGEI